MHYKFISSLFFTLASELLHEEPLTASPFPCV